MLDALARADAEATFFPLSPRGARHPELIDRIRAEGHLVGLHGYEHLRHTEHTRDEVLRDTERALEVLPDVAHWRFPYGAAAEWSHDLAAEFGLQVVGWTHDTYDWRGDAAASMFPAAARAAGEEGAVILCHDAMRTDRHRSHCGETVALVERLLAAAERPAMRIDELPDLQ